MNETGRPGDGGTESESAVAPPVSPSPCLPVSPSSSPSSLAVWLERATVACLFLFALAAPHSIAGAQTAWLLAMLFWVARFFVRPRPKIYRTPVDPWLLGFFVLTFLTALTSYDPEVSIGKLRAASLFTIVYVTAESVRDRRVLRAKHTSVAHALRRHVDDCEEARRAQLAD